MVYFYVVLGVVIVVLYFGSVVVVLSSFNVILGCSCVVHLFFLVLF